ncbi:chromatin remodelling complex Rsc7/Swp82 subunit-domain-containing protein [Chlamydoabsidia padenii]|nr:chromatin remodelling complex Rsc7/Swp82 subunit-domain-containing protein [Chlamydoabsidia padenii]
MPKGRPRRSSGINKVDSSSNTARSSTPETDDLSLRRSTRKRRSSTHQEDEALLSQQTKRRKDDLPPPASEDSDAEQESDIDEAGEKKIDRHGNLQDDRVFKAPTFTLPTRGETVLMLAMEPAKILGFRDSHIFFNKNPSLERVRLTEEEKDILVERNMVLSWFRHRDVAVVTARSVFKRFGAKIIKKGKRCRDDYYEAKAREQGFTGETATIEKKSEVMALKTMVGDDIYDLDDSQNHSRRSILNNNNGDDNNDSGSDTEYTTTASLNDQTWIHYAALGARGFNTQLRHCRNRKSTFYDTHTNINQVPLSTQPSKCEWISLANTTDKKKKTSNDENDESSHTSITFNTTPSNQKDITTTAFEYSYLSYGEFLMDHTKTTEILDSLPAHIRPVVDKLITPPPHLSINNGNISPDTVTAMEYPIALAENQYQDSFPIHFNRFGLNRPIVQGPATVIGRTQSMMAQQHYLNQVYQYVNLTKGLSQGIQQSTPPSFWPQPLPKSNGPSSTSHAIDNTEQRGDQKMSEKDTSEEIKPPVKSTSECTECHQIHAPDTEQPLCDAFSMISCSKCQHKYHPVCANLTTPKQLAAVECYPWSCPECKICCVCTSAGDETKLMICDGCDRGWHTDCCTPPVSEIPEGSWLCPFCAVCHSCDIINEVDMSDDTYADRMHAVAPPTTNYNFPIYLATYCGPCYTNFEEDRFCPVCLRSYTDGDDVADADKEMVACDSCDRWVHSRCDDTLTQERYQQLCDDEGAKYSCPLCSSRVQPTDPGSSIAIMALQGLTRPSGIPIGLIGGKVKTRGLIEYKSHKLGVPGISGTELTGLPTNGLPQ